MSGVADCTTCIYEHTEHLGTHELLSLPIHRIVDGRVLSNGDLHLAVNVGDNVTTYISIPRYTANGERKRKPI